MLSILLRYLWYLRNMTSGLHKFHTRRSTVCIKNALQQKMYSFFPPTAFFYFPDNSDMSEILNEFQVRNFNVLSTFHLKAQK